jgi:hypothetical protein
MGDLFGAQRGLRRVHPRQQHAEAHGEAIDPLVAGKFFGKHGASPLGNSSNDLIS